jgi:hypothetical protein
LFSVADMLEELTCPVCLGPDQVTLVTISPLKADNADNIGIGLGGPARSPFWIRPPTGVIFC